MKERKSAITFTPAFVTQLLDEDDKKVIPDKKIAAKPTPPPPSQSPPSLSRPGLRPPLLPPFPLKPASPPPPPPPQPEEDGGEVVSKPETLDVEEERRPSRDDGDGREVSSRAAEEVEETKSGQVQKKDAEEEPAAPVSRDLQPLMRVLEKTEKHGEELQKRGMSELEEMKKRAQELEFRHRNESAPRTKPCTAEENECISCFKKLDPVRCKPQADAYVRCAAAAFKSTVS